MCCRDRPELRKVSKISSTYGETPEIREVRGAAGSVNSPRLRWERLGAVFSNEKAVELGLGVGAVGSVVPAGRPRIIGEW